MRHIIACHAYITYLLASTFQNHSGEVQRITLQIFSPSLQRLMHELTWILEKVLSRGAHPFCVDEGGFRRLHLHKKDVLW
jgi:hypothetical protein